MNRRCSIAFVLCVACLSGSAFAQRSRQRMQAVPAVNAAEWFPADDYPADAVAAGRSGRTVVELAIDSTGAVVSCRVTQSSGTTSLDEKTCELARSRGRFNPATDRRGRLIAASYTLPVRWVVPEAVKVPVVDLTKPVHVNTVFEWVIGTDGLIESCRLMEGALQGAPDQCRRWAPGLPWGVRYESGGQPVRVVVRDRFDRDAAIAALPR